MLLPRVGPRDTGCSARARGARQGPTHRYRADGNSSFGNPRKCALFWSAVQIRHPFKKKKKVKHEEFHRLAFSPCVILFQGAGCPELQVE